MDTPAHERTSGTDVRSARPLTRDLLVFDLEREVTQLRSEPQWREGDRNSRTLAKEAELRALLTCLRAGAALDEQDADGRVTVHVLEGRVELRLEDGSEELAAGRLAVLEPGNPWRIHAVEESAVLLTLVWRPESGA